MKTSAPNRGFFNVEKDDEQRVQGQQTVLGAAGS
nr:MAG TPA: hypothetical protein [Caudoviricetes sp.]